MVHNTKNTRPTASEGNPPTINKMLLRTPKQKKMLQIGFLFFIILCLLLQKKVDGVGPIDNRPSTN